MPQWASAMKSAESKIKALFDGYLRKPVTRAKLFSELKRFLPHTASSPGGIPEEPYEDAESTISEAAKARWPELVAILETSFIPRWQERSEMLMMDEAETFT